MVTRDLRAGSDRGRGWWLFWGSSPLFLVCKVKPEHETYFHYSVPVDPVDERSSETGTPFLSSRWQVSVKPKALAYSLKNDGSSILSYYLWRGSHEPEGSRHDGNSGDEGTQATTTWKEDFANKKENHDGSGELNPPTLPQANNNVILSPLHLTITATFLACLSLC